MYIVYNISDKATVSMMIDSFIIRKHNRTQVQDCSYKAVSCHINEDREIDSLLVKHQVTLIEQLAVDLNQTLSVN